MNFLLNRLFFQGTGSSTQSALNTYAGNVAAAWNTNVAPLTNSSLILNGVTVEDLSSATSPSGTWAGSHAGGATGTQGAPAVSFIVRNPTGVRRRGGPSRTYVPGIPVTNETSSDANTWNTTFANSLLTAWNAFISAITGVAGPSGYTGTQQVVPYYYHGFKSVQSPTTGRWRNVPTVVTGTPQVPTVLVRTYNPTLGSQRRRNKQGGG